MTTALPENISRCWQNGGYHAHMAGPCFDILAAALSYRDEYDRASAALMKFKETPRWSWEKCLEWENFMRKWRA